MLRITLAVFHLLALAIGLSAIDRRARALRRVSADANALRDAFAADNAWALAALLWIATGLWRWLGSIEKSADYYWSNHVFLAKMGLLVLILLLEVWPMMTLIRWRINRGRGTLPPTETLAPIARRIALVSNVQALLVVAMLVAAVMMARGFGAR